MAENSAPYTNRRLLGREATHAEGDLRATGRITGELVFTVDDQATELSVSAELAPVENP